MEANETVSTESTATPATPAKPEVVKVTIEEKVVARHAMGFSTGSAAMQGDDAMLVEAEKLGRTDGRKAARAALHSTIRNIIATRAV